MWDRTVFGACQKGERDGICGAVSALRLAFFSLLSWAGLLLFVSSFILLRTH